MSGAEINVLEVGDDPYRMTVEGYDEDYYSSFWPADVGYDVLLTFSDRHPPSQDASATIQEPSEPKMQVDYEVVRKYLSEETELLRIDDHAYAVTWQQLEGEMNRVGFISTESNVDLLMELYHQSTQAELHESDQKDLEEFLGNF